MTEELEKFRKLLQDQQEWPGIFFFKFIVPNDRDKLEKIRHLFRYEDRITYRTSKDIRYIAFSYKEVMDSPDEVMEIYRRASEVEGVIAL